MPAPPVLTTVVASRDRPERLRGTLARLSATDPDVPLVVVDDASRDRAAVADAAAAVGAELVRLDAPAGAGARNAGLARVRTPLVAFCDDDSWWAPGALRRAAAHLEDDPRLALVAARVLVGLEGRLDPTSSLMARSPLGRTSAGPRVLGFLACAAVARADALRAVGGFPDHDAVGGEEAPVALALARAGHDLAHAPDVVAHHHPVRRPPTDARRVAVLRGDLWTAWSRRTLRRALGDTVRTARRAPRDPVARRALLAALPGLPRALRRRRPPTARLRARMRALERQDAARPGRLPADPPHHVVPARTPPRPAADCTVVICARDGRRRLARTLAELAALPERPPVIVVDDASTDGTAAWIAEHHPEVDTVVLHRRSGPVARNAGIRRARTAFVALADDDSWWAPGALGRAAELLNEHPTIAVVGARILVGPDEREDPMSVEMARSPLSWDAGLPGHALGSFMAGASVVRRDAVVEVGGFEPRLVVGGEEALLAVELLAAGWALRHVPELVVHHHPEGTRTGEVRVLGLRNALWLAWRRRSARAAATETAALLRASGPRPLTAVALARALAALPWVLATRRPVPPPVEAGLRVLDADRRGSVAVDHGADRRRPIRVRRPG